MLLWDKIVILQGVKATNQHIVVGYANRPKGGGGVASMVKACLHGFNLTPRLR